MYKCYLVGVLCMFMSVCVFSVCTVETIAQSQHVTLGLVPRHSLFALAPVYLWTKGCSETNDLAPVSQSRRTSDEKRKRSEMGKGKMMEAFRQMVKEAGEYKDRGKTGKERKNLKRGERERVGLKENVQFSSGSSHSSSSCRQFSPGNDSFNFLKLFA